MIWLILTGCKKDEDPTSKPSPPPDLSEVLEPGQVRAGEVTDASVLIGGIAAEGKVGDFKIYNDRAVFVVQGMRQGEYYVQQGGMVVDADVVRDGPGRDRIDELGSMFGLGRLVEPESIEVVSDGSNGDAIVRVTGHEAPMALIEGSVGVPGFIPIFGLEVVTEYRLRPESVLLEVTSTITHAGTEPAEFTPGDILMGGPEVSDAWAEGFGMGDLDGSPMLWTGYVGQRNDGAVALVAPPDNTIDAAGLDLIASLADLAAAFLPEVTLQPGDSATFTRYYGVGHDLAEISDAVLALHEVETETLSGTVTAPDGPVAGARVNVFVDDAPYTVAFTDADGNYAADVPKGAKSRVLASGRGNGLHLDLPHGFAPAGPYMPVSDYVGGSVPMADGRGFASASKPEVLGEPAYLDVSAGKLPFEVRVLLTAGEDPVDERVIPGRKSGMAAAGWSMDGSMTLPVEPGTYSVVVHRGMRWEAHQETVTLEAGKTTKVKATLDQAYDHPGWLLGDPHSHGAPSGDGEIAMEDRLATMAGTGVQLHFGTDHDHVANYQPLVEAMGLGKVLRSVIADEVSPVLRGHTNIYPLTPQPDLANNGAFAWWSEAVESTDDQYQKMRARHGDISIQLNHPTDSGMASSAGWTEGAVSRGDYWSSDFDAVEVLNSGETGDFLAFWMDAFHRGILSTPVGVTDSHGHFSGDPGQNGTFFWFDSNDVADYTDDKLRDAMRARATIVSRGIFLDCSIRPGSVITKARDLDCEAHSPSWIGVDRLELYVNGELSETVDGVEATFTLDHADDASFIVMASGDSGMAPVWPNDRPWAMTSPILLDHDDDGWDAPLKKFAITP